MLDSAQQLQRIYLAGFELQTFDRYPNTVGVIRDGCIALLRATPAGLQMVGTPGWRMGEVLGVLVEKDGGPVFQAKSETVEATPERLAALRQFRERFGAAAHSESLRQQHLSRRQHTLHNICYRTLNIKEWPPCFGTLQAHSRTTLG
jgi:hypothetical protein